jgi:hypothetical protein
VLARFATIVKRESLRSIGTERQSIFEARLACHDGSAPNVGRPAQALLVTSWQAADGAKTAFASRSTGARRHWSSLPMPCGGWSRGRVAVLRCRTAALTSTASRPGRL